MSERGMEVFNEQGVFDGPVKDRFVVVAEKFDRQLAGLSGREKRKLELRADSLWEAIGVLDGMDKKQAVKWIQNNSGASVVAEMDKAGEFEGVVWSVQTACDSLTPWKVIVQTVTKLTALENLREVV